MTTAIKKSIYALFILTCYLAVLGTITQTAFAVSDNSRVNCRVELDRAVLPAGAPQQAVVKVTLEAPSPPATIHRPPANIALVLDRSGSMAGRKLTNAKRAAVEALRRLNARDVFAVVVYDHTVKTIVPAQTAHSTEWIESQIHRISSGGNTALFGGVSQGAAEVRRYISGSYVNRIVLLSDGIANVGPSAPDDLGRLGAALIKEGISVTTVGVGTDYNEDLMTRLSQESDGNTYFVESELDLPRIFASELGDVLNVVAKEVRVIIECPEGVRPTSIIGRKGHIRGRKVELYLNQLYGNQEKFVLVQMDIAPGRPNALADIANVQATYQNPFSHKYETSRGKVQARFSSDADVVKKSVNVEVKRDYLYNLDAIAKDEAIQFSDTGKKKDAVKSLKRSSQMLREAGVRYSAPALIQKAEETEKQAEELDADGMTKERRKLLRTESYQMKHQQQKK